MSYGRYEDQHGPKIGKIVFHGMIVAGILAVIGMAGCPYYNVWEQGLKGEAELKRAEQNRRVRVYEAEAKMQAAKMEAQAEVERARGVAEANRIVADGLKGHDEYLRYLWIDKVAASPAREIVYVPTEASLPILEARPRSKTPSEAPDR